VAVQKENGKIRLQSLYVYRQNCHGSKWFCYRGCFAKKLATDVAYDAAQSLALEVVKQSVSKEKKSQQVKVMQAQPNPRSQLATGEIPPLPPGLNVAGVPPAIPQGLNVPGSPPGLIKGPPSE
jgi:hypothetical protein